MKADRLTTDVAQFVSDLKRNHAPERRRNPRGFKKRVIQEIQAHLSPFRGRPRDEELNRIEDLRNSGKTISEAIAAVTSEFSNWNWRHRAAEVNRVRDALKKRRKWRRVNGGSSSPGDIHSQITPDEPPAE